MRVDEHCHAAEDRASDESNRGKQNVPRFFAERGGDFLREKTPKGSFESSSAGTAINKAIGPPGQLIQLVQDLGVRGHRPGVVEVRTGAAIELHEFLNPFVTELPFR